MAFITLNIMSNYPINSTLSLHQSSSFHIKKTSGFKRFRNNYNQQINIELSTKMDDHMDDHMDLYVFHEFSPLRLPT